MVQLKMRGDNVGAAQLAQDLRVLQEAERMHQTQGGMSVIHMEIPPDLSVRLQEMAGREGKLKVGGLPVVCYFQTKAGWLTNSQALLANRCVLVIDSGDLCDSGGAAAS